MISVSIEQMADLTEDLITFVHRVALDENASPAEITALPKIATELLIGKIVLSKKLDGVVADLFEFVHRVSLNEKASPAEIAALPEIVEVVRCNTLF